MGLALNDRAQFCDRDRKAPNGAKFNSPGRSRLCRRSPGLRRRRTEQGPTGRDSKRGLDQLTEISPRWGFCCSAFIN